MTVSETRSSGDISFRNWTALPVTGKSVLTRKSPSAGSASNHRAPADDDRATTENHPADSTVAERLWDTLYLARTTHSTKAAADLEDAVFRFYLPMARTLAHTTVSDRLDRRTAERAAELGLAHAVLAWRQRASGGFRRFARNAIMRQLSAEGQLR